MTRPDDIEQIFDAVLRHPAPGFALGERLAKLFPELAMIESIWPSFDVRSFAAGNPCTVEPRAGLYHQLDSHWDPDDGEVEKPRVCWSIATWNDATYQVVQLTWGSGIGQSDRCFVLGTSRESCVAFYDAVCRWNHEVRGEILVFREGCFSKSTELYEAIVVASFDQLVLEGSLKQQIRDDFTQFLASRQTYEEHGVPWKRGALFIGPPGNGKTLCVKALVHLLGIPCLYVQSFEAQYGTVQAQIEAVFARARATTPCLLVLEDIDALLVEGSRSFFLNELDGFASNTGIITLATTNHPERLDPSIVERPSRFDRKYHFGLPSAAARGDYVAAWNQRLLSALRLSESGRAQVVAETEGFSFAYVQEVFVSAMMRWMVSRDPAGILPVALEQIELLRAQMQSVTT